MSSRGPWEDGRQVIENQPFDEAFDIDDPEEVASNLAVSPAVPVRGPAGRGRGMDRGNTPPEGPVSGDDSSGYEDVKYDDPKPVARQQQDTGRMKALTTRPEVRPASSEGSMESSADSEDDDELHAPKMEGAYDPKEYEALDVSPEIRDLFSFISKYSAHVEDLETRLRPFIPDYIPAVGDIDAMIKIPRVDGKESGLGLLVLDEPCAAQSDPTVLDLQLRSISKTAATKAIAVKSVENVPQNIKVIDSWISSITTLHRDKPPQTVNYTKELPNLEALMQEWPSDFEELLREAQLPGATLDVPLSDYASVVCALLDIPVHKSKIESLHLLFSLYLEFKNSQHFRAKAASLP